MRFYFNTANGELGLTLQSGTGISGPQEEKRGDDDPLEVVFHKNGVLQDLDAAASGEALKFGAKVTGDYDGSYVFAETRALGVGWAKTNGWMFTDAVTNSTAKLTSATAAFNQADVGLNIVGAGIAPGTTILAVGDGEVTLSAAATATATGVTITIQGRETVYTAWPSFNTTKGNNLLGFDPEGFAEVTEIRCVGGNATAKGFKLFDAAGSVGVWIDLDNAGAAAPSQAAACARQLEITTIATGDTASQKATKIAAALQSDGAWTAAATGSLVTAIDIAIGTRTAAADFTAPQATGFGISTWIHGSAPNTMANTGSVALDAEIEVVALGKRKSSQTFTLSLVFDENQGNEGVPRDATPPYPRPDEVGLKIIPPNSRSADYTTVLDDSGKAIVHPATDNNARTFTIDSNANVPYPLGTAITFINEINAVTIAITADTLTLSGDGSTGSRTLAASGIATAVKVAATRWLISGPGLS